MMLAVAGVAVEDGEMLLVRDPHGFWAGVGGFIEPGETPEDAILREIREELGVEAEITGLFRPVLLWNVGGATGFLLFIYAVTLISHDFTPQASEVTAIRWARAWEFEDLEMLPWIRAMFRQRAGEWFAGRS